MSTVTIKHWLIQASAELSGISDSPRLDAELLLCHTIKKTRSHLFAWPEKQLSSDQLQQLSLQLNDRKNGIPVAYLTQQKEFWSLTLQVNADVLVPRPDTETLVQTAINYGDALQAKHPHSLQVLDLGTGSGAIACALAYERSQWSITAVDRSIPAIAVAKRNAENYHLKNIHWVVSDWFEQLNQQKFHLIVSNPPYIPENDPHLNSDGTKHEPLCALVAEDNGLADLKVIAINARKHLISGGWLWMEHGFNQSHSVSEILHHLGYHEIQHHHDGQHQRITGGRFIQTN